jgi:S1-C subfamily serine protease
MTRDPRGLLRALAVLLLVALAAPPSTLAAAQWAWLGVRIRDLSEQEMDEISSRHGLREGFGVFIVEVMEGTPAQTAGLKNGDLVVAFEERPVTETRVLQRFIASSAPGKDVRLTVLRAEGRRRFDVRDPEPGASTAVAVSVVVPRSSADRAGLEVGDVILQVNDLGIVTRDAFREALADSGLEAPLRLTVRRPSNGDRLSLVLQAPGA